MAVAGPLVGPGAGATLWAVLAAAAAAGQVLENRTKWGASVSAPLLTMGISIALSWSGIIPTASPTFELVWSQIMPLAVCFYLLETDVRKVFSDAGTTFKAFVIGALGTVLGTIIAFACVGRWMGPDGWKMAACLCASYVGGSINYAATAQALGVASGASLAAGMAADNLAMAAYFGVLMSWPTGTDGQQDDDKNARRAQFEKSVQSERAFGGELFAAVNQTAVSLKERQLNTSTDQNDGDVASSGRDGENGLVDDSGRSLGRLQRAYSQRVSISDEAETRSRAEPSGRFLRSSESGVATEEVRRFGDGGSVSGTELAERSISGRNAGSSGNGAGNGTTYETGYETRSERTNGVGYEEGKAYGHGNDGGNGNGNGNGNGAERLRENVQLSGTGEIGGEMGDSDEQHARPSTEEERARPSAESVSLSLAAAAGSCCLGQALASALPPAFAGTELALMAVIASLISVTVGQLTSGGRDSGPHIAAFAGAEMIGGALMQVFFAVVGATASLQEAINGGWPLLIFILVLLAVHVAFIAVLGSKVFKLPIRSVLIASNANVGGPATAAAMASAKGWPDLVRGALLTGTLGYTVGTAIGCLVGTLLRVM
ncbi:hypothetical protein KFL_000130580 [Klebsormidium nitens]|uniref:DUF819 domain-containing protein n=1 Tax=Klebsormidium nitens TaxID=105231 RepID=A0A1Y1HPD8_KLENI|nr:hypothetical protein KFL_000130580 [Klebsormidium nitens]|eukprot:GAQ78476.1 hypothetical protein KFL_000130580 [Klebsormidium nitens]